MIRVKAGSLDAAVFDLGQVGPLLRTAAMEGLQAAGLVLAQDVRANISLTDHTLADLAKMDHPYATRHGRILVHPERPYSVHKQSGKLLRALKQHMSVTGGYFEVWLDEGEVDYAKHVVEGTKVMLARDVLWDTAAQASTRKAMMRSYIRVVGKEFKAKAAIRFGGRAGSGTRL